MFKQEVMSISDLVNIYLRKEGLETPLLQKRLVDSWSIVAGAYCREVYCGEIYKKSDSFCKDIESCFAA